MIELREAPSHPLERARELAHLVRAVIGHGLVEHPVRDPLRSALQPAQAAREDPRAGVADDERERERHAAGDEQAALDDAHIPEGAIERGREQQDRAISANGVGHLGEALAVAGNRRPTRREVARRRGSPADPREPSSELHPPHESPATLISSGTRDSGRSSTTRAFAVVDARSKKSGSFGNSLAICSRERGRDALEVVEAGVDEPVLERGRDREVDEAERHRHHEQQREAQPRTDTAERVHVSRKR